MLAIEDNQPGIRLIPPESSQTFWMWLAILREESLDLERTFSALQPPLRVIDRFDAGLGQRRKIGRSVVMERQKDRYYGRKEGGASYFGAQ
ncbi:hypothetical protein [Actinomadura madurae]|uniref:hypothetical protein n=1 Tax=Actinomadura madurae TaxID=1993 RepID=UPI0032B0252A